MNWGNKLLITFVVFGGGMFYLVYRSVTTNFELVDKDYYKNELRYQDVIDGVKRANALNDVVKLTPTVKGLELQLPAEMRDQKIAGTVHFYCAYDALKDRKFELNTDATGLQVLNAKLIASGNYTVKINWNAGGEEYYTEKSISLP
jgi:FixH